MKPSQSMPPTIQYFPALEVFGIRSRCHGARIELIRCETESGDRMLCGVCGCCDDIVVRVNPKTRCIEWNESNPFRPMPRECVAVAGVVLKHVEV